MERKRSGIEVLASFALATSVPAAPAASAAAAPVVVRRMVSGGNDAMLPPGGIEVSRFGAQYYLSGNTCYQPAYGANGIFHRVVPAP
jgi:hypothetical protein